MIHAQKKVLVIDDCTEDAVLEIRWLNSTGYDAAEWSSCGEEAISRLSSGCFDIVVSDVGFPGRTALLESRLLEELPVVVVSLHATREWAYVLFGKKMKAFLSKPLRKEEFLAAVKEVVGEL